jgi:PST family polysaccharide transporter
LWERILGNSGWLLTEKILRWTIGMTVGVWTARYLGPDRFGALNYALSYVALFAGAVTLGIDYIAVRDLVHAPDKRPEILGTIFWLRVVTGAVMAAAAVGSALLFGCDTGGRALVGIISLMLLLGSGDVFDLWFQADLRARRAMTARTAALVIAAGLRITLILSRASLAAFAWLIVVEAALTSIALGLAFRGAGGLANWSGFSLARARALLRESWPNIVSNIAVMSYMRLDRIMLGEMKGDGATGVYSAAAALVEVWYVVPLAVAASATPMITRLYLSDAREYLRQVGNLARLLSLAGWMLAVALSLAAWWLIPWLFGPAYAGTGSVLAILAWGLPFVFLGVAASPWYLNERLFVTAMWRHLAGAAINLGLNILLIPRWGAAGAASATVVAFASAHVFANAVDARTRPVFRLQIRAWFLRPSKNSP